MRTAPLTTVVVACVLAIGTVPAFAASGGVRATPASACNIKDLSCWGKGKKCNIKFVNVTGKSSGSGGSQYNQVTLSQTIRVKAVKASGGRAGSNTLKITDGASSTLNLDKKKDFAEIDVESATAPSRGVMHIPCDDVRATLTAGKNCRIFTAKNGDFWRLAYNCGVVSGRSSNYVLHKNTD